MKNLVIFGFSAVILITTILIMVLLGNIKQANENVLDLIEKYDLKVEYAHTMSNAVRARQISLLSMLVIKDEFELYEEISRFYGYAAPYRKARKAILALPMSDEEKNILSLLDGQTDISQPLGTQAAEMFRDKQSKKDITRVINLWMSSQIKLFSYIDQFVTMQKKYDDAALNFSREKFHNSIFWISLLGAFVFMLSVFISWFVTKAVEEKNQELLLANERMESAYKKAEEATVIKSEFLATMSHEIRTPLTAVIGFAESMLFKEQTVYQRLAATKTIIRSGKHLLQIINDILDLSKIEANKLEVEKVELSPFDLLADLKYLVQPAAEDKGLGFSINYIFPLPVKIVSDPLRIKQILINLCNNAIKFTESGYVVINVSSDFNDSNIIFEVVDSGIGICKEQQEVIFQAYQQAESSTTRKFGGTGLGLSLSKTLTEKLGGTLTVHSELGKGSQFKLILSINSIEDTDIVYDRKHLPAINIDADNNIATVHLSGVVLLVEDSKDNQELLLIYLRRMGLEVFTADNGLQALNTVQKNDFDLILMDMRMPVMGGIEATKRLRQQGFNKPIIALTANVMSEDRNACAEAGCNDFVSKPVELKKLAETLEKYLESKDPFEKKEGQKIALISSLLEDEPETINLIMRYIQTLPGTLEEIGSLMQSRNWEKLSEVLYELKGSGANLGYPAISALAAKMEFQVLNENTVELNKLLFDLQEICQQIAAGINEVQI